MAESLPSRPSSASGSPEALQTVDVGAVPTPELAPVMLHQAVDVALGSDARVGGQSVGAHDGPQPDLAANQREEGLSCEIRDDLGPDLPSARCSSTHFEVFQQQIAQPNTLGVITCFLDYP